MSLEPSKDKILIIDFGSQVTKLIARRVRDLGVYSEIVNPKDFIRIKHYSNIKGIILSGGPDTVTKKSFFIIPREIFLMKIPILGICYGLQLITKIFGGKVQSNIKKREFGRVVLKKKYKFSINKKFL